MILFAILTKVYIIIHGGVIEQILEEEFSWRIDYNMISEPLLESLKQVEILSDIIHSDHCPVLVELEK